MYRYTILYELKRLINFAHRILQIIAIEVKWLLLQLAPLNPCVFA
jgi:hypothetical protein